MTPLGIFSLLLPQKLLVADALIGETSAALLASNMAISSGFNSFSLKGDSLLVILAINNHLFFCTWNFLIFCFILVVICLPFKARIL